MDGPVLVLRVALALACVVGLIWLASRKLGGVQGRRKLTAPEMQVVSRQVFGRHSGVAVLAVGNRRLLLGYGEQQVTMLTELAPVADTAPHPAGLSLAAGGSGSTPGTAGGGSLPGSRRASAASAAAPLLAAVPAARPELDIDAVLAQARLDAVREPAAGDAEPSAVPSPALDGPHGTAKAGPLDGSILSPSTWRRAINVLQDRTVRR
ncbi:flagellar biosynthetic protein FliO [Cellulomonas chengniuliangii]|uniref:Flagellar biosynthetic protein FliO n=1 Tax=Cellulomonas chengniuliangii TaxID=2968084 RepID=A0ABY5L378_9CELL|nr:flagellar biosynthetic protein FliO [Cellulomonas chengniuliangii]MCC2307254.1 flagellar biosynthetic protein FliO [Cellulomonas chengniuliangii]MCC2317850.1 flagellar biosynthetic protein FliO [Cellulomonas chengniuliangii]UUI75951.1 flagellar biosynthetic protein FliO [Cellulomonas chengniuliangii]